MRKILSSNDGLIKARINPREENYYLVTNSDIDSIKSNSIFLQLFLTLASLFLGGLLSTFLASISINLTEDLYFPIELKILFWVFLFLCILFLGITVLYTIKTKAIYKNLESESEVNIIPEDETEFYIIKARYGANGKYMDVKNELNNLIENNILEFGEKYNTLKGDPIVGTKKELTIEYFHKEKFYIKVYPENEYIKLPEE